MTARRVTVVTNPHSGVGRGHRVATAALAAFTASGAELTEVRAATAAESVRLVRDSIEDPARRPDAVVCVGGDGLVNVLLPALANTGVPLGLVPAGTGNDLAREMGVPVDDPAAAVAVVLTGHTRTLDLGLIERGAASQYFVTVAGTGFDARVTLRANAMRRPRGSLRYTVAALAELGSGLGVPYRLELDGLAPGALDNPRADDGRAVLETEAVMVAVGNTRTYGGGMLICPDADPEDGLLDLTVVGAVSRLEMLRLLPALSAGRRIDHPATTQLRVAAVTLTAPGAPATADGEPAGELPITVRAVPAALRILVPA